MVSKQIDDSELERGEVLNLVNLNPGIFLQPVPVLRSVDISQDKQVIEINQVPFFLVLLVFSCKLELLEAVIQVLRRLTGSIYFRKNSTVVESGKVLHRVIKGHQLEQRLIIKRAEQVGVHQELFRASVGNHIAKMLQLDGIGKNTIIAIAGIGTFFPAENRSHNGQRFLLVNDGRITCHHIVVKEVVRTETVYVSDKQAHFS